ncbi:hypothetical protein [uncultured Brachyspira sp.]|uniref:hypothetical protein n=1 Tax=uncultured Brachyspira sp. TaxID=221953 RepID=UPI00261FCCE6|nr:hypothetical protein [uncultured Brachyspira sp.]
MHGHGDACANNYICQGFGEGVDTANGAFSSSKGYYSRSVEDGSYAGGYQIKNIIFDASLSSPIYGRSNTVQPPSVVVKYIIKAE